MPEIIMSIKPQYVQKILNGEKTVELRNRKLNVQDGTRVWIYSTLPKGCIEVVANVESIEYACQDKIWALYSKEIAISEEEFEMYVQQSELVSAIKLVNIKRVTSPITLNFIRSCVKKFHPPQFFSHLKSDMELSNLLSKEGLANF